LKKDTFKFEDIDNFNRHIELSIPNYKGLVDIFTSFAYEFTTHDGVLIDLGCSTGSFLEQLPKIKSAQYIGVDEVEFVDQINVNNEFDYTFIKGDILDCLTEYNNDDIDVIVLMFTLQFLGNKKRKKVVQELKKFVERGTTVLISEKVYLNDSKVNSILQRNHRAMKRHNFTDTEIVNKEYQLAGSMFNKSYTDIIEELNFIGNVNQVWQSYNFMGWVIK